MDFYFVLFIFVAAGILYASFKVGGKPSAAATRRGGTKPLSKAGRLFAENEAWLHERWKLAQADAAAGRTDMFPSWYFDEPSERQLERLAQEDARATGKVSKGQVSDMIGLFEPAEDDKLEVLRFFKVSVAGMNQTRARHEAALLMRDPEKAEAWEQRPPSPLQLECLRFFGLPKPTTHAAAQGAISSALAELEEKDDPRVQEWHHYESVLDRFDDPEALREEFEIKRPSPALLRRAVEELRNESVSFEQMDDEPELVRDRLLKLKPELLRPFDDA